MGVVEDVSIVEVVVFEADVGTDERGAAPVATGGVEVVVGVSGSGETELSSLGDPDRGVGRFLKTLVNEAIVRLNVGERIQLRS